MGKSVITKFRTGSEANPKTVGIIVDLHGTEFNSLSEWGASDVSGIYKLHKNSNEELYAAAKGKVILIDRNEQQPKAICYQANGKSAESAWCGNSYAAAAAYLNREGWSPKFQVLNKSVLSVDASVTSLGNGNYSVSQVWEIEKQFILNDTQRFFRHRAIFLKFLNEYRVIISNSLKNFEACFNRLAKQRSTLRLTDKICLFHPESGKVAFLTASYIHGAAPVTGLCSLSFLRQRVGWLSEKMSSSIVLTPNDEEYHLPDLEISKNKIKMNINTIIVNLQNL